MNKRILYLFMVIILIGCKPILLKYYGVKTKVPYKTKDEVLKFAIKRNFDTAGLFFNSPAIIRKIKKLDLSPNVTIFFNKDGYLINDTISKSCKEKLKNNLSSILDKRGYRIDSTVNLSSFLNALNQTNPSKNLAIDFKNDYYAILSWATYAGKFNKTNYKSMYDMIKNINSLNIKIVSINMDFMQGEDYKLKK